MVNDIDVSRSVLISGLPSAFLKDSTEDFAETIYELLETTFSVTRDAIDHLVRSPLLEPGQKGFGCKCLISFRSRVHRHRVIAQKSKLEPPTKIESITEVPRDILDSSEEVLEVTDEWAEENGMQAKEAKGDGGNTGHSADAANPTPKAQANPTPKAQVRDGRRKIVDSKKKTTLPAKPNLDEYADDDEDIVLVEEDSASTVESPALRKDLNISQSDRTESERPDEVSVNNLPKSGGKCSNEEDDMLELPPLSPVDIHREHHFSKLLLSWDGAPEFQWKTVTDEGENLLLKIENIVPSDLLNPWLYPVVLNACSMKTDFPELSFNEVGKPSFGKVDLFFSDSNTLISCALNYLVYMRTFRGRRAKIYLPHTKPILKCGSSLEKRLGRVRVPTPGMSQLLVKPVPDNITEKQIRNDAFPHHTIAKVEFKQDSLKQRCAVLTFASAQRAIAAHSDTNIIAFGKTEGNGIVATVLYPYVAVPDWDSGENLLVTAEMKKKDGAPSEKEKHIEGDRKRDVVTSKDKEENKALENKREPERKSSEKGPAKDKSETGKREIRGNPVEKRTHSAPKSSFAEPSSKVPRGRSSLHRGSSFASRGSHALSKRTDWRGASTVQPLHSVRPNYSYSRGGSMNEFSYSSHYKPQEAYRDPGERFAVERMEKTSTWRNNYGTYGNQPTRINTYREESFQSQPEQLTSTCWRSGLDSRSSMLEGNKRLMEDSEAMLEERLREQREKLAYKEQMLRQQKLIDDLEKQLRAQTQLGGGGYIGSFEERPETAVQQHFPEETVPRAKWNTSGLSTSYNVNERMNRW